MSNPVTWFEIMGTDGNALRSFYSDLFGWRLQVLDEMNYGMVEGADGGIGGGIGESQNGGGQVTVYVQVDDPQVYLDKAERLGGRTVAPVTVIPDMVTFAQFADPEGHVVGLVKAQPQ
jgi:predicted enzyme related to lactoylglutathione lyase